MKTFIAKGSSPENAFATQDGAFELWLNETRAFHKSGLTLEEFAKHDVEQNDITEGCCNYITIREPKTKSTKQKFKVENIVAKGAKKWVTMINFLDDSGKIIETASTKTLKKSQAISRAKVLAAEHKTPISLVLSKEVVGSTGLIAEVQLKEEDVLGEYFFYGIETSKLDD